MVKLPVYMDYNATTPCDPRVVEVMTPYFTKHFGNAASRTHLFGWEAEEAVEQARERIAALIGAETKEIIFTSGATESDNLAIKGVFELYASKGNHIITCVTEHKAVLDTCKHVEKNGAEITYLNVNPDGLIDLAELESAIRSTTILIAIMYANNEIGTIQPIREIGAIAKKHNILFFSDSTQAVGKIPVNVIEDGIDIMAFSSHKMYGPKGVGALYVRRKNPRVKLAAQIDGGGHERGLRSGTLNVPGIVGFGKAAEIAANEMKNDSKRLFELRDRLEKALSNIDEIKVNGSTGHRIPNVSNISFKFIDGGALMSGLNKTIAVSTGSACSSASMEPSYVLKALGLEDDMALSSLRFSLGKFSTEEEVDYVVEKVKEVVGELRALRLTS
jgi:cysteine desulfurase